MKGLKLRQAEFILAFVEDGYWNLCKSRIHICSKCVKMWRSSSGVTVLLLVYRNLRGLFAVWGVAADWVCAVYDGVHAVVEGVLVGSWGEGKVKFVDAGGCFAHGVDPAVPVGE